MEEQNELIPKKKFFGPIKPGEVRNPKGRPDIVNAPKPGMKTDQGKFWNSLLKYSTNSMAKTLHKIRRCKVCPLGARVNKKGETVIQCAHYDIKRRKCIIPVNSFLEQCKVFRAAEKEGWASVAKLIAAKTSAMADMRLEKDLLMDGAPSELTAKFQQLAGEQAHNILKIEQGEKQVITANVATVDMNELMNIEREKIIKKHGKLVFDDESK